jgi:hypothetical protein
MLHSIALRSFLLCGVTGALLFLIASPAHAGIFGKDNPVPQWGLDAAKIKTPDYAKGSSYVVLFDEYVETVDDQGRAVERERRAKRILEPQGRDVTCDADFDIDEKINYFREWTIGADEKTYQAKDTDFIEVGDTRYRIMLSTRKARIVHPPAADVGATILCESEVQTAPWRQEMIWDIQSGVPIVDESLEVDLPSGRPYAVSWHRYDPVAPTQVAPNHWRWEIKDMQKLDLRGVKSTLEWQALAARMSVTWGQAAVTGKDNEWRAFGQWMTGLESSRTDPTPEIAAMAHQLVAGAPDFYTRLKSITEYIQKNVEYFVVERGIGGYQAHFVSDIFRNRYGDCKDKTALLISMLQAVGIKAWSVSVDDRRGVVDPDAPSLAGNHMITAIEIPSDLNDPRLMAVVKAIDGKRYLIFDPTNERTPVGNLPDYEQGSFGILGAGDASQLIALPVLPPEANGKDRKGTFALAADGALTGSVDTSSTGPAGAETRYLLKYTTEKEQKEQVEKSVAQDLPGVVLDNFKFIQPSDLDKPMELDYKVTVPQYAHQAGPLLLVRPRVVGDDAVPFDDKPRKYPIDLEATGHWHDVFDIALPAGYVVDETPDPVDLDVDFASYHSAVTAKDNMLHYERDYVVRKVEIPPEKAAEFRKFESQILSDQKGTAVLKKQ